MGLKQRKRIKNISRFTDGTDGNTTQYWDWQNNKPNSLYNYKCGKNPKRRMK